MQWLLTNNCGEELICMIKVSHFPNVEKLPYLSQNYFQIICLIINVRSSYQATTRWKMRETKLFIAFLTVFSCFSFFSKFYVTRVVVECEHLEFLSFHWAMTVHKYLFCLTLILECDILWSRWYWKQKSTVKK